MKKIISCLIGIIILIGTTGCEVSKNTSDKLFNSLKNEEIIDNDLEFVETITSKTFSILIKSETYYIYQNANDSFLAIQYSSCNGDYTCDAKYKVSIYDALLTDDPIVYINENDLGSKEHYYIFDNKYAENNKYDLALKKEYFATEKSKLFKGKYYTFE